MAPRNSTRRGVPHILPKQPHHADSLHRFLFRYTFHPYCIPVRTTAAFRTTACSCCARYDCALLYFWYQVSRISCQVSYRRVLYYYCCCCRHHGIIPGTPGAAVSRAGVSYQVTGHRSQIPGHRCLVSYNGILSRKRNDRRRSTSYVPHAWYLVSRTRYYLVSNIFYTPTGTNSAANMFLVS